MRRRSRGCVFKITRLEKPKAKKGQATEMTASVRSFRDRDSREKVYLVVLLVVMFCCLAGEGMLVLVGSMMGVAVGSIMGVAGAQLVPWCLLVLATFFYFKWPIVTLALSWLNLAMLVPLAFEGRFSNESFSEALSGYVFVLGAPVVYILVSHLGYFGLLKKPRAITSHA